MNRLQKEDLPKESVTKTDGKAPSTTPSSENPPASASEELTSPELELAPVEETSSEEPSPDDLPLDEELPELIYQSSTGRAGVVNQEMSIAPSSLIVQGAPITSCEMKAETDPLPADFTIDPTSCVISGTPTTPLPVTTFTFIAHNEEGASREVALTISVSSIACDSGSYEDECQFNSVHTLTAGQMIAGLGDLTVKNGGQISGPPLEIIPISFAGDITIELGGAITANADVSARNLTVAVGASLNADSLGYQGNPAAAGSGPGAGRYQTTMRVGSGGSHGGYGNRTSSIDSAFVTYGSATEPTEFGSSGGGGSSSVPGGHGGGFLRLRIQETLHIEGVLSASGGDTPSNEYSTAGGGAGGSIWIEAETLMGEGSLKATGGIPGSSTGCCGQRGGVGGGGRIAITSATKFPGTISVAGGTNATSFNGTLHMQIANICDTGNLNTICYISTPFSIAADTFIEGSGDMIVTPTGGFFTAPETTLHLKANSLVLETGAVVHANIKAELGSLDVQAGVSMSATALGYGSSPSSNGFGPAGGGFAIMSGGSSVGTGGGHGGLGGSVGSLEAATAAYGSEFEPDTFGSGGGGNAFAPGGRGGGLLYFKANEMITLASDLQANGQTGLSSIHGGSGGGAGGSIYLAAEQILGIVELQALGVAGTNGSGCCSYGGGGGGGGRISIVTNNSFLGLVDVTGGAGSTGKYGHGSAGEPGSVFPPFSP